MSAADHAILAALAGLFWIILPWVFIRKDLDLNQPERKTMTETAEKKQPKTVTLEGLTEIARKMTDKQLRREIDVCHTRLGIKIYPSLAGGLFAGSRFIMLGPTRTVEGAKNLLRACEEELGKRQK